ncbi:DUF3667 domain-containing protein [Inhella proteolytica]|uniref:DUF3667 domain-containing protein n=1 Tax=Inhella proteolytica TaxID=2795029 RepID=A0A931J5S3_9BURK|nr:DUF3667 domain-containing protein [Inhella proteolytica]MBH9578054.1 DUF3667 domain-containing protein [Inhella proteolytica]
MSEANTSCANCGHRLHPWDKFCSQCGQDTLDHPPSLWEFVHEFLLHYVAFEGKLWKSLWALLAKPGFLTAEYLAGRKQRYVLPLRLILTLGLVFFLVLKIEPSDDLLVLDGDRPATAASEPAADNDAEATGRGPESLDPVAKAKAEYARQRASDAKANESQGGNGKGDDASLSELTKAMPGPVARAMERSQARFKADPKAESRRLGARMLALAPYAVLCSLPFYAGLLALLYRNRRQPFGAHFVFAMHLHAAWYGVLLLAQLPHWTAVTFAVLWGNAYPVLALKRVYDGAWWKTLLRATLLCFLHLLLLMLGFVLLALVGALT